MRARQCPDDRALLFGGTQDDVITYAEPFGAAGRVGAEPTIRYPATCRPACMRAGRPPLPASPELGRELLAELIERSDWQAVLTVVEDQQPHRLATHGACRCCRRTPACC
ncbi:hypothetical protein [Streptomyces kaempferi]|uniref:hypothetical protein n=1 Tax=Streptomyces kaempferi TaxID=333725 RepID=UPI003620221B